VRVRSRHGRCQRPSMAIRPRHSGVVGHLALPGVFSRLARRACTCAGDLQVGVPQRRPRGARYRWCGCLRVSRRRWIRPPKRYRLCAGILGPAVRRRARICGLGRLWIRHARTMRAHVRHVARARGLVDELTITEVDRERSHHPCARSRTDHDPRRWTAKRARAAMCRRRSRRGRDRRHHRTSVSVRPSRRARRRRPSRRRENSSESERRGCGASRQSRWSALPSGVAGGSYFLRTRHQFASESKIGRLRSRRTVSLASGSSARISSSRGANLRRGFLPRRGAGHMIP